MNGFRTWFLKVRLLAVLMVGIAGLGYSSIAAFGQRVEDLPTPTDYVTDNAHVLSQAAIERIDKICKQLDTEAKAQVAVVTVKSLDGDEQADYANRLFARYKIGAKGTDRGLLILLAVDDRKRQIEVGYGLEGILPDGKVGDIGRQMVPFLQASDYDGAVLLAVSQVATVIAADAKVTLSDQGVAAQPEVNPREHAVQIGKTIKMILIIVFIIFYIVMRILRGFGVFGRGWVGGPWIGGGGGYGGGFGGGGGGGGGFGGFGGGSSGGGGAGGGW